MSEGLKLLPCPNCGNPYPAFSRTPGEGHYCICKRCGMRGPLADDRAPAFAAWNALPRHLRWTKDKPTEPGFYFFLKDSRFGVVIVGIDGKDLYAVFDGTYWPIDEFGHGAAAMKWAGPIPEPEEADA